jgi:hypothetical protein
MPSRPRARTHVPILTLAIGLAIPPIASACGQGSSSAPVDSPGETTNDAGDRDAGDRLDAAPPFDAAAPPIDTFDASLPDPLVTLSQTGLYADLAKKTVADSAVPFVPVSPLWSDGAEKHRWIVLPPGTTIDTSDMDHWRFPVGTRLFKEFAREGKRLETRLIAHRADTGVVDDDWWVGSFVWRDDESDADLAPDGQEDIRGTDHDAPSQTRCFACHIGEPGRVLGFSALQLSKGAGASGTTVRSLASAGLLSHPPPTGTDAPFPEAGSPAGLAAAYLHANCGHCHNPAGAAWPDTSMVLRLSVADGDLAQSDLVKTTVGVALSRWSKPGYALRIAPGTPSASGVLYRMSARGDNDQMPPIATEHTDPAGLGALTTWIESL